MLFETLTHFKIKPNLILIESLIKTHRITGDPGHAIKIEQLAG